MVHNFRSTKPDLLFFSPPTVPNIKTILRYCYHRPWNQLKTCVVGTCEHPVCKQRQGCIISFGTTDQREQLKKTCCFKTRFFVANDRPIANKFQLYNAETTHVANRRIHTVKAQMQAFHVKRKRNRHNTILSLNFSIISFQKKNGVQGKNANGRHLKPVSGFQGWQWV